MTLTTKLAVIEFINPSALSSATLPCSRAWQPLQNSTFEWGTSQPSSKNYALLAFSSFTTGTSTSASAVNSSERRVLRKWRIQYSTTPSCNPVQQKQTICPEEVFPVVLLGNAPANHGCQVLQLRRQPKFSSPESRSSRVTSGAAKTKLQKIQYYGSPDNSVASDLKMLRKP